DLDSTLFNNVPRNRKIIEEFAETMVQGSSPSISVFKYPELNKAVKTMKDEQIAYSLEETFKNIGVNDEKTLKELKKVWYDKFFTDKYVVLDKAYDGAADYVKKLHSKGAMIVYLTGRDTPDMKTGTISSLKDGGFPFGDSNSVLLTKPEKKMKDDDYKNAASADILKMGTVVASFDNEPKNVNLFKKTFPGAVIIFIETNHSPKAVPVEAGIPWVKSWK
ncbi:MAG TPA: HAD family acid phosphatase, partial [Candidatus Wallbacteria bacterium]|nr:HAD family acid phosphatase [Candidatus Wallbacteria bacterium]